MRFLAVAADKPLLHANRRLCHHTSDYRAPDGIRREFISGIFSFLKANELPDNKTVPAVGHWEVTSRRLLSAAADCDDS